MADVFLSYKKEERAKAEEVVAALRAAGHSVWWDEDLTPRSSWDAEIEREIAAAKAVLVLWSTQSVQEHSFVRREAGYALDHGKLVPAFIERCPLPLRFRDVQTVDLSNWDRRDWAHPEWRRALSWLAPLIGRPATSSAKKGASARGEQIQTAVEFDPAYPESIDPYFHYKVTEHERRAIDSTVERRLKEASDRTQLLRMVIDEPSAGVRSRLLQAGTIGLSSKQQENLVWLQEPWTEDQISLVRKIIEQDEHLYVYWIAMGCVGGWSGSAKTDGIGLLKHVAASARDPHRRKAAVNTLVNLSGNNPELVPFIRDRVLSDESNYVRRGICQRLGAPGNRTHTLPELYEFGEQWLLQTGANFDPAYRWTGKEEEEWRNKIIPNYSAFEGRSLLSQNDPYLPAHNFPPIPERPTIFSVMKRLFS